MPDHWHPTDYAKHIQYAAKGVACFGGCSLFFHIFSYAILSTFCFCKQPVYNANAKTR